MKSISSQELALHCVKAAIDKKGIHSLVYEVGKLGAFTDYFLITSGTSDRHVKAIADGIDQMAKEEGIARPRIEGYDDARWVLVDFGDVVVHIFQDAIREFYDLESLWSDAPRLRVPKEFYTSPVSQETGSAAHR